MLKRKKKVNDHYKVGGIEVIDYLKAKLTPEQYYGFLKGNALKYVSRAGYKEDEVKDLNKAVEYLNWMIEVKKQNDITRKMFRNYDKPSSLFKKIQSYYTHYFRRKNNSNR